MKTSDKGIAFLVAHEGVVPGPYLDPLTGVVAAFSLSHPCL